MAAGGRTRVGEAESVSSQGVELPGHPGADLIGHQVVEVTGGDERAGGARQLGGQIGHALRLIRVQEVVLVRLQGLTAQLVPAGDRPHGGSHAPVLGQQTAGLAGPGDGYARGEQLHLGTVPFGRTIEAVNAPDNPLHVNGCGLGRLVDRLVVDR